jgi:hypothetical protein
MGESFLNFLFRSSSGDPVLDRLSNRNGWRIQAWAYLMLAIGSAIFLLLLAMTGPR